MTSKVLKPAIAATVGCMLFSTPILAIHIDDNDDAVDDDERLRPQRH